MRRTTITDTAARLCLGDLIQNPDGQWMQIADITYATNDGPLGAHAVLLVNPALGTHRARLMLLGANFTRTIQRDLTRTPRPHLEEHTKVRRVGLGFEVWDTICLEWVYIVPGAWRDEFDGAREADEATLNRLMEDTAMTDTEVNRVVTALRSSIYQGTAEHVLNTTPQTVDKAIELGMVRVVKVQSTTYNRRGERMLAAA
jgi:hypothetical protein